MGVENLTAPAALGKSLWLSLKCGDFNKGIEYLEQINNIPDENSIDRDEALEYSDKRCNGMLHVAIAARAEGPEELMAKRTVVSALLKHGFVLDDTNLDGKACKDMCPASFEKDMRELEDQRQKKARGNSIYAEYRNFQNVAEAGFMAMAAIKFKKRLNNFRNSPNTKGSPARAVNNENLSANVGFKTLF